MNKSFEEQLVEAIISENRAKEHLLLSKIYKELTPKIYKYIKRNSGTEEDAKDLMQETLLILIANIKLGKYKIQSNLTGYLTRVYKYQWLNRLRANKKKPITEFLDKDSLIPMFKEDSDIAFLLEREDLFNILERNFKKLKTEKLKYYQLLKGTILEGKKIKTVQTEYEWMRKTTYKYLKKLNSLAKKYLKNLVMNDENYLKTIKKENYVRGNS